MVMLGFLLRFMRAHPSILVSISIVLFLQPTTTTTTGEVVELVEMEIEHGRWQRIALATVELLVRPYVSNCQSGVWTSVGGGTPRVQSFWLDNSTTLGKWDFCYISLIRDIGAVKVDVQVWESGGIWYGSRRGYTEGANAICVSYH